MVLGGNKRFRETQMGGAPPPIFVAGVGFSGSGFDHGAVGLRIVAAMSSSVEPGSGPKPVEDRKPKRSDPIPIRGMRVGPTVEFEEEEETATEEEDEEDDVELSESYTCVISHVGGGAVRKRVYVGDDDDDGIGGKFGVNSGVFFESPPPRPPVGPMAPGDFLSSCYLCRKKLHGLDIFMYRGEAFCSVECRCQQILNDDYKEKCRSGAAKAREPFVLLPYRASLIFDAGVAAA